MALCVSWVCCVKKLINREDAPVRSCGKLFRSSTTVLSLPSSLVNTWSVISICGFDYSPTTSKKKKNFLQKLISLFLLWEMKAIPCDKLPRLNWRPHTSEWTTFPCLDFTLYQFGDSLDDLKWVFRTFFFVSLNFFEIPSHLYKKLNEIMTLFECWSRHQLHTDATKRLKT